MEPLPEILCPSCSHRNRSERRYCAQCGGRLGEVCSSCGTLNETGERFCGHCGALLTGTAAEGERGQLTVLFPPRSSRLRRDGKRSPHATENFDRETLCPFLMLSELFQNNHHRAPGRLNFAARRFEFDPTFAVLRLLARTGALRLRPAALEVS